MPTICRFIYIDLLSDFITEIKTWMSNIFLCLNSDKTGVMLIGSRHQTSKVVSLSLTLDGSVLGIQSKMRNL